jgi:hypothetical protein
VALGSLCAACALATLGCGDTCQAGDGELVSFVDGQTNAAGTFYQTGPIQGPYLHFPSGRIFELEHHLIAAPNSFQALLSFDSRALLDRANNVAESAGNQAVVDCIDSELIRIRNDTCAEFYLRLEARVDGEGLAAAETRGCR